MLKQYRQLENGEELVIGADPADTRDFCSAVVISKRYADSPLVFNDRINSSQFGFELNKLGIFVHNATGFYPVIGVERNTGQATIAKLLELNYPCLFRMASFDYRTQKEEERIGWVTTESSRIKLLDELASALSKRLHKIYDAETISQLLTFIRHPRTGKPQSESGCFDDLVFSEGIAWQLYLLAPSQKPTVYVVSENDISKKNWSLR